MGVSDVVSIKTHGGVVGHAHHRRSQTNLVCLAPNVWLSGCMFGVQLCKYVCPIVQSVLVSDRQ